MHLTNKVEYVLATKELIHLSYTTYARALGFMKKILASLVTVLHTCVSIKLKYYRSSIKILIKITSYEHFH